MTYDKIVKSTMAPKETNVVWIDVTTDPALIKVFNNGAWVIAGGVGGGGKSNLEVGTYEDRINYEEPYDGLEFHQVTVDEQTQTSHVNRFIYENNDWVELESPQTETVEKVALHVTTYDGLGVVEGLHLTVKDNRTQTVVSKIIDHDGNTSFEIPKGHSYTITIEDLAGYHSLPDETFMASMDEKSITLVYLKASTNYETVIAHITVYNKNLVDVTSSDTDFIGMTVNLTVEGEDTPRAGIIDSDHKTSFQVEYGKSYTLNAPTKDGYKVRYQASKTFTHIAGVPQRELPMHYMMWDADGIVGIDTNGTHYSYDAIEAMSSEERANIIAVGVNTSRLSTAGASFMYKLPTGATSKQWASANVEFDKALLPFKSNHAQAVLDLDGKTNTQNIIDIGDSMGVDTPAADYCQSQTITINGETKVGFLGAFGQVYALAENIAVLNALHSLLGKSAPGFTSGYWWTSTQCSSDGAVRLGNGSFYGNGKTSSLTTLPLFEL